MGYGPTNDAWLPTRHHCETRLSLYQFTAARNEGVDEV